MYAFLEALALPKGPSESWTPVDLSPLLCRDIAHNYAEAYITLTHPVLKETQVLLLTAVEVELSGFSGTFDEWLTAVGNKTLPTVPGKTELTSGNAEFKDAVYAGYKILPFDANRHPDTELSLDQKVDLLLRRKNVDYPDMEKNVLATVNGLFHRAGASPTGYVVYDGGRSANHAKLNQVGLLNFQRVSKFECINIEKSWFTKPLPLLGYKDRFYLKVPKSLRGKTVMLVIAGFLITPGETFCKINDNVLSVSWNRLSMIDRYYLADQLLDLRDHVKLSTLEDGRRVTAEMLSDDFVVQMCTLPQSFLVVFDEPNISIDSEKLETLHVPGRWLLHRRPQGLLRVDLGYAPEYTVSSEQGNQFVLQTLPQYQRTILTATNRRDGETLQDNQYHGAYAGRLGQGHLVSFSSERVKIIPA